MSLLYKEALNILPIAFFITYNSRSFSPITLDGGIPFDLEGAVF